MSNNLVRKIINKLEDKVEGESESCHVNRKLSFRIPMGIPSDDFVALHHWSLVQLAAHQTLKLLMK